MTLIQKVGAVAGFAAPAIAFTCIILAIASYPQFSWTNNALSDLGVVQGLTSVLFNFGLGTAGILAFIFAVLGLTKYAGERRLGRLGAAVFAVATVALICIAVFNENYAPTHYIVSVGFFVFAPIAFFILTCAFHLNNQRSLAAFTVAVGVVAALPWILQFTIYYVPNVAIPETISGLAVTVWVVTLAAKMLKKSAVT